MKEKRMKNKIINKVKTKMMRTMYIKKLKINNTNFHIFLLSSYSYNY